MTGARRPAPFRSAALGAVIAWVLVFALGAGTGLLALLVLWPIYTVHLLACGVVAAVVVGLGGRYWLRGGSTMIVVIAALLTLVLFAALPLLVAHYSGDRADIGVSRRSV